jgi:hypothetical protein
MIRIEDFLFLENVEQSQAESLIATYSNLSFETTQDFRDYFQRQGIRLVIKQNQESLIAFDDTQVLLERLKNFKSSTDYDYVKKYIIREKIIDEAVQVGKIEFAKNEFDSLAKEELDPFFGFIVRKMLTGNENGVLPSENLKAILDEQNRRNTEINTDINVQVERDSTGKIISFKNYLKNRGFVSFDTTTERYAPRSFDYVIDKSFTSIPEAVEAERYVLEKAEEWATDINVSADEAVFLEKLRKLINEDSTSVPALESKIEKLQLQLSEAEEVQQNMNDTNDNLLEAIEQLSVEFNQKVSESEAKDAQIVTLNQTIDSTLTDLGTSVTAQIENAADAFDALSTKLEEQSKKSEEAATKQLEAFEKAVGGIVGGITDALKPKEPEPDPENPAAEIINQILERWDGMTVITERSYPKFIQILDILGAKKPSKSTYVFVPPAKGNLYNPSEEIKQHLKWNNEIKVQIKALLPQINDKTKAQTILTNVNDIRNDSTGSFNNTALIATIRDALGAWVDDVAKIRGVATPIIRKLALELGANFPNSNDLGNDKPSAVLAASRISAKLTTDTDQLINTLTILDEIKNNIGTGFGW